MALYYNWVGKFLPLDGKNCFFHGKNCPGKNSFCYYFCWQLAKSQSKVFLQLQNKSEILL